MPSSVPLTDEGIDLFMGSLPRWSDVSPNQTENSGVPTGGGRGQRRMADDTLFTCTTTPYNITKIPRRLPFTIPTRLCCGRGLDSW
ncbi:MAG: hypothetical protein IPL78_28465 [Chloroflexi bacterium]|nr:hypothetical protein [Chloroflexota bacterium]